MSLDIRREHFLVKKVGGGFLVKIGEGIMFDMMR